MDFMKVFDQTVREIKREVNIKVLKVPEMEQKVLDATCNEPWGPHGSDLAEIAQATKKFTECQMIMNVLWTRLTDSGRYWRHVYKALTVLEYLVANGSERAVDDIIEHSFQISSLSGFEYVEPNGKDSGINVRKKVETILGLLNNKEKIQEVRNKAAANRDKYFGLSSSGVTYKSSSASNGSSSFQSSDRYGSSSATKEGDMFKDNYKNKDRFGEEEFHRDGRDKPRGLSVSVNEINNSKKASSSYGSRDHDALSSRSSRISKNLNNSDDNYGPIPSQSSSAPPDNVEDDFDDFDPRGTSATGSTTANVNQVDLFGESLFGDLMDAPTYIPTEMTALNSNAEAEVDLFADATFVSAPHKEEGQGSQTQANDDLFSSQPAIPSSLSSTVDFFNSVDPVPQNGTYSQKSEPISSNTIDPFAAVQLNNFDGSDLFGAFSSHPDPVSTEPKQNSTEDATLNILSQKSITESKAPPKKDNFQVRSGIWADSLSRGLIDLNISAPKKINLSDIGIVGGLSDGSDEKEKLPPSSAYMGRAMGAGTGLGKSGFNSSSDDFFSALGHQKQFGSFKK